MLANFAVTVFSFALYHPNPVIVCETLFSRWIVTLSNGESSLVLMTQETAAVYTPDIAADVRLHINEDTIEVECIIPQENNSFKGRGNLEIIKNERADYFRKSIHQKHDLSIPFNGKRISGENGIVLESNADMNLESIVLQSPLVALFAKQYNFNNCVCDAETLIVASQDPNSWYDSIHFVFDKDVETSHAVNGKIDFEKDNGDFTVRGVKTIKIILSEQAFTSQGEPILEIKPGEDLFKI
jgi:hypothetical protein